MTELVARAVTSLACLVAVVILALAGVVDGEIVALAVGTLLPSPVGAVSRPLVARKVPR